MNTQHNNLFHSISKEETNQLIAIEGTTAGKTHHKPFTAAELWDIQRRRRSFVQRRFNA